MTGLTSATLVALIIQLALGFAVFQANPGRKANQAFLLLSLAAAGWLASLYAAVIAAEPASAEMAIRVAWGSGVVILATLNLLRLSIIEKEERWATILRHSSIWIVVAAAMVFFCQTDFFLRDAEVFVTGRPAPPKPIYGPGAFFYGIYFASAIGWLMIKVRRDLRRSMAGERAELSIVLVGCVLAIAAPLFVSLILQLFFEPGRVLWLAPFRVVFFSVAVGYVIATRKILEVGFFIRRVLAYTLLATYLLALYALIWWLMFTILGSFALGHHTSVPHIVAALAVAFAMAPARGLSQSLANRLFMGTRGPDFRTTMSEAAAILRSVTTLEDLLDRFAKTIAAAVGTERILILLPERKLYVQQHPPTSSKADSTGLILDYNQAIIEYLATAQEPIVLDELHRMRPTAQLQRVSRQMASLQIAAAVGIFSREHLAGVLLLGERLSGQRYGSIEQSALQVLCGQLAVAIENATLFTEVQNAKIYNDILLENLTTGVIAARTDGIITVLNTEAEQITQLKADEFIDRSVDLLPMPLREVINEALRSGQRQENRELVLERDEENVIARASSSVFHGQDGQVMGALMVLTDITAVKRLEQQIRRSDRLASLGTLSAGMAHEIKNPLVSIKTFAQLLPERYQDSDFRETFSNLIGHEIDRIDTLVNQLLRFARPAKPLLKPMHVHEVLEKSLMLVGHRLYQKEIKLSRSWNADVDTIRADADQMEQVFLNFFLNAMDAMKHGGELVVATEIQSPNEWVRSMNRSNDQVDEVLRVTVRDDGQGIRSEDIPHVFDPFFTTKDYGTGLGLSVVHGIIQEHGGQIEVESEPAKGTAFHILLPLVRFRAEVAAA
jgi:PAS domain S-box-containing protein